MLHSDKNIVRPPAVAGMFYDESPEDLRKSITGFLERVKIPKLNDKVKAVVSPHAGYIYSGFTAAHAYKLIAGNKYDCVIVVGPSHREYFDGISIYPGEAYETPLGTIPIHKEIRAELLNEKKAIVASKAGHGAEHSIEVQLPFLQNVLGEFSLLPIIMGDQRSELCSVLAETLAQVVNDRNILLVASSDLSHFHPYNEAVKLDSYVIEELKNYDSAKFVDDLEANKFEACGGGPIAAVMETAHFMGAKKAEILHYCNSGDITGDKRSVVGYLAAAFH
jgi:AmmeMemoRadiSam system protein B